MGRPKKINAHRLKARDTKCLIRGRPPKDDRLMVEAMFWVLRTGSPWPDLPDFFGPWKSVYTRFRRWSKEGLWDSILESLRECFADCEWLMIDSTVVRAHQHAAGARGGQDAQALGRSKGGFSSKIHLLSDALGYPLHYIVTGGERADCTQALALLRQCVQTPEAVIADKGYDSDAIREGVMQQASAAVIPAKSNRKAPVPHDKLLYAARHLAENAINKLKNNRRLATRYDKTVNSFMAFIAIACIKIYLFH